MFAMPSSAEQTKHKLLRAARQEFAAFGLAGARVDRIAQAAGVNKQRIYGYFGSKDGLFDAVLEHTMIEAAADKPLQPGDSPADYAGRTFDFHRRHPDLLRLLMWEALSRPLDSALSDSERQTHYERKVEAFVAAGLDDSDARYALLAVLALTTYTAALPQVTSLILGQDYSSDGLRAKLIAFADQLTAG